MKNNWKRLFLSIFVLKIMQIIMVTSKPIPEQIHISFGSNSTEMLVTWHTLQNVTEEPIVEYGLSETTLTEQTKAEVSFYDKISLYTYRALLPNLKPLTRYYYRVGSNNTNSSSWSKVFQFRSISDDSNWLPSLTVYGDLGYQNEESLPFLAKDVEADLFDGIFHIGDMGYDLYERNGEQGNDFMRSIEKIAAQIPYMTCPGNHEKMDNFTHYDVRFSMLSDRSKPAHSSPLASRINNFFHSIDLGPAHIIMLTTEFYFYTHWGWDQIRFQYEWLEQDLIAANQNRDQRPWIIVMAHRPLYCLKIGDTSCNQFSLERVQIRQGVHMYGNKSSVLQYGLEDLFWKYGVDLQFYGHEHFYARFAPVYKHKARMGQDDNPYKDPDGPVHFITGSAGNRELHAIVNPLIWLQKWIVEQHIDYGYTRLRFLDRLRLSIEQTSDEKDGIVIDRVEISKSFERPKWML